MAQAEEKSEAKENVLIGKFREEYAQAVAEARISAEHTSTDGWRLLYQAEREAEAKELRNIRNSLEGFASGLSKHFGEDDEKLVGEIKKRMQSLRERRDNFHLHTVEPVKHPVEACRRVIEKFTEEAKREEREAPLHRNGLTVLMGTAISRATTVSWNDETGEVEIRD